MKTSKTRQVIDPLPDHMKFGYAAMLEKEEIAASLRAQGQEPTIFAIERAYISAHRNDPTLRERQEAARKAAPAPTGSSVFLTFEEAAYLIELFDGANNPTAAAILVKCQAMMA